MTHAGTFWRLGSDDPVNALMRWPVATVETTDRLPEVSRTLAENEVGAVLVLRTGAMVGVLSERDVAAHMATDAEPRQVTAAEAMSSAWLSVSPEAPILEAARMMREAHVRHLPVVSDGLVTGILSMRDVFEVLLGRADTR